MPTIKAILSTIEVVKYIGSTKVDINKVVELKNFKDDPYALTWCNDKNISNLTNIKRGTIICSPKIEEFGFNSGCNYIIVNNPRRVFRSVILNFFHKERKKNFISTSAIIDKSNKIGKNPFIGHNVVIEEDCVIGDNVSIDHNTVIYPNTIIEDNVKIGSNNTIGGVGFGYEKDDDNAFKLIPHIGNVVIKSNVEIGNNTCIDRAVLGSTIIHENVKIDNLVHIAHGVVVGKNSLVIANSMIAGSTTIGENVWVAPSTSIINGISVGDNSMIGMGSVVIKPIEMDVVVVGNPAKVIRQIN